MNKKSHDHGFTIKRAVERIREREDNTFTKKAISGILKMYAEECLETLLNGGKVSIKGVGTIRPSLVEYKHCGLPTVNDKDGYSRKIVNIMLSNCKKHYNPKCKTVSDLPLGVRYSTSIKKYYGEITPYGHDEVIRLSYWDTQEEAFAEYKMIKQADILIMAAKYKNKVPKYIYEALLKVDVKPY